jgi:23S rRNA pseudouridine955/2504/2580 synthase
MTTGDSTSGKVRHVTAAAGDAGQRLDNFLLRELKGVPRSHVYRVLRKGEVRINGKRAKPEYRLAEGDQVRLPPVRQAQPETPGRVPDALLARMRQSIVHEDERVLVLAKPAGLAVHGGSGLAFGVIEALRADRPHAELELVHRLDRDTSGLLVVAKKRSALRVLHALLREGEVEKHYLALVAGKWKLGKKTIDAPLMTNLRQGGERVVRVHSEGKLAASTFRPVRSFGSSATLMDVEIHTGRTHQIRVHAAHAGHPVLGDDKYGDKEANARLKAAGLARMFLHSHALAFTWPDTGERFSVEVPLPDELEAVLQRLAPAAR